MQSKFKTKCYLFLKSAKFLRKNFKKKKLKIL